jgi:hypothetical protein
MPNLKLISKTVNKKVFINIDNIIMIEEFISDTPKKERHCYVYLGGMNDPILFKMDFDKFNEKYLK